MNKQGYDEAVDGDYIFLSYPTSTTRRGRVGHGIAQTLLTSDGGGVLMEEWLSDKGVKYVLSPKRGSWTTINGDIAQCATAKGMQNWTGTFIAPDIESVEMQSAMGSKEPNKAMLNDGTSLSIDDEGNITDINTGEPYRKKIRIRKLTPREYWRLMDFDDDDFDKASQVVSNTQLYKQAGNSIVVNCLVAIFGQMFEGKEEVYKDK